MGKVMGVINWKSGFFRAWVLISIIWALGLFAVMLPGAAEKITVARMSDTKLMMAFEECKLSPGVPQPPEGFYLVECLKRLKQEGRTVTGWGGGNGYMEQVFRVARAFLSESAILFAPPLCLLLFGISFGWVIKGFRKNKPQFPP